MQAPAARLAPFCIAQMFYTWWSMKRSYVTTALLALLIALPALHAVEKPFAPAKILDIQQKARTRVLYYLVNTPVTQDDPYYEVSVQIGGMTYIGEYTPRHAAEVLPEDWKTDTVVQARVEKHYLYLKRPSGGEVQLVIVKHIASGSTQKTLDPVTNK